MTSHLTHPTLLAYLRLTDELLHGKALELREAILGWLAYIPSTFPHYTRHTVQHSDEIILQLSKLLFHEDDPARPIIRLSPLEAYVLLAASYLHDAGMVTPDREKAEILASPEWRSWTSGEGGGARRWREVEALRGAPEPPDPNVRHFLADLQTRFLVAEFVRRVHHLRAAQVIAQHQSALGRFALDDPILARTVSAVCVGHGLQYHELQNDDRYPDRRDIRGHAVNVRLLATLFRLGDLLDMTHDRACPLLLNAACPLPADSFAHWTQYQRIIHRLTAPDRIEIVAECHNQDEHRVLQDWCQWIVDEVRNAALSMTRATRHADWRPPAASMDGPEATIKIQPASTARYIPSRWTFELDRDAVLQRLIFDVHHHPRTFIRELLQNALDATRCRMYLDLAAEGQDQPAYPTEVDETRRTRYPVRVTLRGQMVVNELSGETEDRQVLTVDDPGNGMDREIIERYFLQIGRSYYTTEQFRRTFRFIPTSRFGVGFLSVFAASDHVTVETYKPESARRDGPIRLTLRGPRTYLLTEKGERRTSGTRIEVLLREPMSPGELAGLVSGWCRRVEFPILADDLGSEVTITAERPDMFTYEMPDVTTDRAQFFVRAFPLSKPGIAGELYVFGRLDEQGENWAAWDWARYTYPSMHPGATSPPFPDGLVCLHGIAIGGDRSSGPVCTRVDYRGGSAVPELARERMRHRAWYGPGIPVEFEDRLEEILRLHVRQAQRAGGEDAWKYKQRLVRYFPLPTFWAAEPGMIRLFRGGQPHLLSLNEARRLPAITSVIRAPRNRLHPRYEDMGKTAIQEIQSDFFILTHEDIPHLSHQHRSAIFRDRSVTRVWPAGDGFLALDWSLGVSETKLLASHNRPPIALCELPSTFSIGIPVHKTTDDIYAHLLLNTRNPFVQWLLRVGEACSHGAHGLTTDQFDRLMSLCTTPLTYGGHELPLLARYIDGWRKIPDLPPDLYPPDLKLEQRMFW